MVENVEKLPKMLKRHRKPPKMYENRIMYTNLENF